MFSTNWASECLEILDVIYVYFFFPPFIFKMKNENISGTTYPNL